MSPAKPVNLRSSRTRSPAMAANHLCDGALHLGQIASFDLDPISYRPRRHLNVNRSTRHRDRRDRIDGHGLLRADCHHEGGNATPGQGGRRTAENRVGGHAPTIAPNHHTRDAERR
jgi:hypothetical protein